MTKATTAEGDDLRHSLNWVVARRGILEVWDHSLVCGEWSIPYPEIDEAVLYHVRQWFVPGYVLCVRSGGKIYQFGLNWNRFWSGELPFSVKRERARLGYSPFSIATRIAIFGLLAYWLFIRSRGG